MTTPEPEQFVLTPAPALPPATVEAMREIPSDGQRMWIATLVFSVLAGKRTLAALQETLAHERLDPDLVARIVGPMEERP